MQCNYRQHCVARTCITGPVVVLTDCDISGFDDLAQANLSALARPRQQARFLCGLSSPAVSAIRGLRGNPLFGRCEGVAFSEVLTHCQQGIL